MSLIVYSVAVNEPFRSKPHQMIATSRSGLLRIIRLRVNFLEHEYASSCLPAVLNTLLFTLFATLDVMLLFLSVASGTIQIWSVITVILFLLTILYVKYSPCGRISLTHTHYYWRCLTIWRIELARQCAADQQET